MLQFKLRDKISSSKVSLSDTHTLSMMMWISSWKSCWSVLIHDHDEYKWSTLLFSLYQPLKCILPLLLISFHWSASYLLEFYSSCKLKQSCPSVNFVLKMAHGTVFSPCTPSSCSLSESLCLLKSGATENCYCARKHCVYNCLWPPPPFCLADHSQIEPIVSQLFFGCKGTGSVYIITWSKILMSTRVVLLLSFSCSIPGWMPSQLQPFSLILRSGNNQK